MHPYSIDLVRQLAADRAERLRRTRPSRDPAVTRLRHTIRRER